MGEIGLLLMGAVMLLGMVALLFGAVFFALLAKPLSFLLRLVSGNDTTTPEEMLEGMNEKKEEK